MTVLVMRLALAFAVLLLIALAAGYACDRFMRSRERAQNPPPGKLVERGGHKLHILCKGANAGPTVVIEPGAAEPSMLWWAVQDAVSSFARVCTYDRAGYQWSDPVSKPRSITDRARELRALLAAAQIPGPYVLVSHSYSGAIMRAWARENASDIAGAVFVDTPDELNLFNPSYRRVVERGRWILPLIGFAMRCGIFRLLSAVAGDDENEPPLTSEAKRNWPLAFTPSALDAAYDDLVSIANATTAERTPLAPGAFGDRPLIVVAHGIPFPAPFAGLEPGFRESQQRLAALSARGELVVAEHANHNIQLDQPEIVIEAIRRVVLIARSDGP